MGLHILKYHGRLIAEDLAGQTGIEGTRIAVLGGDNAGCARDTGRYELGA